MTGKDILGMIVLILAYGLTWLLFLRSLWIVSRIDRENIHSIEQIRSRLKRGRSLPAVDEEEE